MQNTVYTETEKITVGKEAPLIYLNFCLPRLPEGDKTPLVKSFTAYYKALRTGFLQFAEGALQKSARAKTGEGFKPYGAVLSAVVAYENEGLASLYVDASVSTGEEKRVHRISQLWRKDIGTLLKARQLFVKGASKKLIPLLLDSAERYMESTGNALFSDWEKQLKKNFEKDRLYISPKGFVFYYQAGVLSAKQKPLPLHLPMESVAPLLKPESAKLVLKET